MSQEKLATEIMYLSTLVNANTELCSFVRYSGHVDVLHVQISESKENYNSKIFDKEAYTSNRVGLSYLKDIRAELIQILTDHNVPYETLNFGGPKEVVQDPEAASEGPKLEDRIATLEKEMAELKKLVSDQPVRVVAADVPEELPRSRGDRQEIQERLEGRFQKTH